MEEDNKQETLWEHLESVIPENSTRGSMRTFQDKTLAEQQQSLPLKLIFQATDPACLQNLEELLDGENVSVPTNFCK